MKKETIAPGSKKADSKFKIEITPDGPYLIYGKPPMSIYRIVQDKDGRSWEYKKGESFLMASQPTALCRCGRSFKKPYCDGTHIHAKWDPALTASREPILKDAKVYGGTSVSITDNESYCAFARFCDAKGRIWNIVEQSEDPQIREAVIHEANMCPGARLSAWDNETKQPFEPEFEPSLGLIEDPQIRASGPIWVRGGIPVIDPEGMTFEIRNRVVLCRCGASSNKPYCNGAHATMRFRDGLD